MGKFKAQYGNLWDAIKGTDKAHQKAVGGDFETVGKLELALMKSLGLQADSSVIDVGCGSGRLAVQLAPWLKGSYLGTDILAPLLDYARDLCGRDDWTFLATEGQSIPAPDQSADFVCFFSVFTHISHEETWAYILESKRVLKPGGKLVCSFLEFKIRSHWTIFKNTSADKAPNKILNQFLSRDTLEAFAFNSSMNLLGFHDGDTPHIPIDEELAFESGIKVSGLGNLGQSVCVMEKPLVPIPLPV